MLQQPARCGVHRVLRAVAIGHGDHHAVGQGFGVDGAQREVVGALERRAPQMRDELAQVAVTIEVAGQHDERERGVALHPELAAHQQRQAVFFGSHVGPHHPRQGTFVHQRERAVAQRLGSLDQLFGVARAAQEGEVGDAAQLGVVGELHAKCPCKYHAGVSSSRV